MYHDHNNSSEASMMMRQAWLGIVSAPKQQYQSCAEGDQCALHGHWSFAHLNEVDENGVPTLVCNSKACAAVDRPAAAAAATTKTTTTTTMEDALRMSGWVDHHQQQQQHNGGDDSAGSGSSKASVDWKRYFYKHLHLDWFHVQPVSASSVARAQLGPERMSSDESTLRGWRIFLVVVASVFFLTCCTVFCNS